MQEIETAIEGRRLARHHGQVFFTVYDKEEADRWKERGASVRQELTGSDGSVTHQTFWEVHISSMHDPVIVTDEYGFETDVRSQVVLDNFRRRDGFALPEIIFGR